MSHIPFRVTVTLSSDLVFKNYCVWSISLIFFKVGFTKFGVYMHLGIAESQYPFLGHCDLDL